MTVDALVVHGEAGNGPFGHKFATTHPETAFILLSRAIRGCDLAALEQGAQRYLLRIDHERTSGVGDDATVEQTPIFEGWRSFPGYAFDLEGSLR